MLCDESCLSAKSRTGQVFLDRPLGISNDRSRIRDRLSRHGVARGTSLWFFLDAEELTVECGQSIEGLAPTVLLDDLGATVLAR